ncbi:MAG: hydroxymethylbilane synthase [Chitinophagia bacterium]|nr:hydroxymethylbilane synthase [Chitinophagia bacterium]
MTKTVRIGTRSSELATWQATWVKDKLTMLGANCELVFIENTGDIDTVTPLYQMGVQGVFTKALDIALLQKEIDIAVHSMKDVPITLPEGIAEAAVLERASHKDVLVCNQQPDFLNNPTQTLTIATSSLRRKAQWLNKYPDTNIENIRGNLTTRLAKLKNSDWHGALFAQAGLDRLGIKPTYCIELDWMIPAPAQGAVMVNCLQTREDLLALCAGINHWHTQICCHVERTFLKTLEGGCTAPIGAYAQIAGKQILFKGNKLSEDGSQIAYTMREGEIEDYRQMGWLAAQDILNY